MMSKIIFSEKEIQLLQQNPYVQRVSERAITYSDAFKSKFIDEYLVGKTPRQIFEEYGFKEEILGLKRIEQSALRWRQAYEKNGVIGLTDSRKSQSGRTLKRELTPAEVIERQAAHIQLLEGQINLLKKLETTERRLLNKNQKLSTTNVFQLMSDTLSSQSFKCMVSYFVSYYTCLVQAIIIS